MWNFNYAIPSLMILAVIVGHYISLPRLPLMKNKLFLYLVIVESLDMTLDVISSWADTNYELFPVWSLYALNSMYFILFFARGFAFFLCTARILNVNFIHKTFLISIVEFPLNLGIVLIAIAPWIHWFYYIDDRGYHAGPLYNSLYLIFGSYLIFSFVTIYYKRDYFVRKRELQILLGFNTVLTVGLIMRFMFPNILLMNVFCLAAFIVLYLGFENPDNYLVERTLIFNKLALADYLQELNGRKPIYAFVFGARSYHDKLDLYGMQQFSRGIYAIQDYLRKNFRDFLIFSYGECKFVFIAKEKPDWQIINLILQERFKEPWIADNTEIYLDISGAIINLDSRKLPFEVLLHTFFEAFMKVDSDLGDEIITITNKDTEGLLEEIEIKRALENAIANDSVEIYMQPIIDTVTDRVAGAEALARIKDINGKIIPPGKFIPIAEKNGKINQLGKQVFRKCCEYLSSEEFLELDLSFVNVNLSPVQLMRLDLNESLSDFLKETGACADTIHLEITEEAMVNEQLLQKQIKLLTEKGFKFVLDDYGTGYSNITRLRKTPFINVKLDMSVVWDYCANPDDILPGEIETFKKSGFEITAEGIESEDMANKMTVIGCRYLQGFYFSKPIPVDEFILRYKIKVPR